MNGPAPLILLLGPRGSGKSTVGRLLAQRLGALFIGLDEQVQRTAGRTIAELFASEGQAGFREREARALADALAQPRGKVIATGGGVVERPGNRRLLIDAGGLRVFLFADPGELHRRTSADPQTAALRPPLSTQPPEQELRDTLARRLPLYREVAKDELDVTAMTPAEIVDAILALPGKW